MLIGAPLAGAQVASAQPYPPPPPLTVTTTTVTVGGLLSFSTEPGVFAPGQLVTALVESRPIIVGRFRAQADGSVAGTVTIPRQIDSGWHVFRLTSDRPGHSVGVTIFVEGGLGDPSPSPTVTKSPRPRPSHPGDHDNHDGRNGSHGRTTDAGPADYQSEHQHHNQNHRPHHDDKALAATGGDHTLALGGTAAALLVAGGGTLLAVRRRRSS
ncbi:hypothetical protein ACFW08_21140 [Streptomyces sp. NPDC058960]|uniref:hypothetical protein n=1 Tax=Streptomyces sp. NPDC058960 TaxID=3346679 RepID=UPI00367F2D4F